MTQINTNRHKRQYFLIEKNKDRTILVSTCVIRWKISNVSRLIVDERGRLFILKWSEKDKSEQIHEMLNKLNKSSEFAHLHKKDF